MTTASAQRLAIDAGLSGQWARLRAPVIVNSPDGASGDMYGETTDNVQTVLGWMRRSNTTLAPDPLAGLSAQERNILPLIAEGGINREIARQLALSEHTVKTYISNILQKLQMTNRSELAAFVGRAERVEHPDSHDAP